MKLWKIRIGKEWKGNVWTQWLKSSQKMEQSSNKLKEQYIIIYSKEGNQKICKKFTDLIAFIEFLILYINLFSFIKVSFRLRGNIHSFIHSIKNSTHLIYLQNLCSQIKTLVPGNFQTILYYCLYLSAFS